MDFLFFNLAACGFWVVSLCVLRPVFVGLIILLCLSKALNLSGTLSVSDSCTHLVPRDTFFKQRSFIKGVCEYTCLVRLAEFA